MHPPALGSSWGTGAIALASIVYFSALGSRLVVHELLIGIFVTITTPVILMLLARAALYRDRAEGNANVPARSALRRSLISNTGPETEATDERPGLKES